MDQTLSQIPDHILARLFSRKLWQRYDAGGFSVWRSLQANLLEAYLDLNRYDCLPSFSLDLKDFAEEAERRKPLFIRQTVLGDMGNLSLISTSDISLLCIDALRIWYQIHKGERCPAGYVCSTWEGRFIQSICKIMPIPFFPFLKSDEDFAKIWKEANDRVRIMFESQNLF